MLSPRNIPLGPSGRDADLRIAYDAEEYTRNLLSSVVESSFDAIIGMDLEGLITSWNGAAQTLFGYTAEEVLGRSFSILRADGTPEQAVEIVRNVLDSGRLEKTETIRTGKGGAELSVLIAYAPIFDLAGNATGIFKTVRDVTRQRRMEADLRSADELLHIAQQAAKAGIWDWDIETGKSTYSPEFCELCGLDPDNPPATYQAFFDRIHPDDRGRIAAETQQVVATGADLRQEYRILREGEVRWVTSVGSTVARRGTHRRIVGITIDTTDLRRAEEAARQNARLESVGRLAGGIAHDFNNLLAGILGGATFLEEVLPETHPGHSILGIIRRSSERAALLTKQLLAYSGKSITTPRKMDLAKTVRDACAIAQAAMPSNIEVIPEPSPALPLIEADVSQVRDVIVHLLANGGDAMCGNAGVICVRTGFERFRADELERCGTTRFGSTSAPAAGPYVYVEVSDNGEGMTPDVIRRMYEPFFTTRFTGRGLGLSAVHGIVRAHSGAIEVRSRPGNGTVVRVYFPALEPKELAATETMPFAGTVLVIDDEEVVRHIVHAALGRAGYRVLTASEGESGLDIFRDSVDDISIVLLDVSMPGLASSKVLQELRRIRPEIPVIITSGYSAGEALAQFPEGSTAGFIQKPFTVRELSAAIKKVPGASATITAL